jgi:hypothetical protein
MSAIGQKEITVTYRGFTAAFVVTVSGAPSPPVVTGIELATLPAKLEYEVSEMLDLSGLVVKAVYSDGSKGVLPYDSAGTSGYKSSVPDMSSIGTKVVLISYRPGNGTFSQFFAIEVTLSADYDGAVDNETERGSNLLAVLGASSVPQAWEMLHERINADGLANYHNLHLMDYLDLTMGLPLAGLTWDVANTNLRIYIVGFNIYKGINGNTKNHIVWGFRNCPLYRGISSNTIAPSSANFADTELYAFLDFDFAAALENALGNDYFYRVNRRMKQSNNADSMVSPKVWLPTEGEIFGAVNYSNDPAPQVPIPLYIKGDTHRIKYYAANANDWQLGSLQSQYSICMVYRNGTPSCMSPNTNPSPSSPHFCQR